MARPTPEILLQNIDSNGRALEVCDADNLYAVLYQGRPIKIRTFKNIEVNFVGPKYGKTAFPESGHAFNLAEKLNAMFDTNEFTVAIMEPRRTITE